MTGRQPAEPAEQQRIRLAGVPAATARARLSAVAPADLRAEIEPHGYLVDVLARPDPASEGGGRTVGVDAVKAAADTIKDHFGADVYAVGDATLSEVLVAELRARGMSCSTAESCTGGWLGASITAVPGASEVYWGGVITYDDDAKRGLLDVPPAELARFGAVSRQVALAMARGITRRSGTTWGAAVTGVAGPGGGSEAKPVGTVWIAVCGPQERVRRFRFSGGRANVRRCSVQAALDGLRRCLTDR